MNLLLVYTESMVSSQPSTEHPGNYTLNLTEEFTNPYAFSSITQLQFVIVNRTTGIVRIAGMISRLWRRESHTAKCFESTGPFATQRTGTGFAVTGEAGPFSGYVSTSLLILIFVYFEMTVFPTRRGLPSVLVCVLQELRTCSIGISHSRQALFRVCDASALNETVKISCTL